VVRTLIALSLLLPLPQATFAHPGGLAGDGCHNDRKKGGRHCHRGGGAATSGQGIAQLRTTAGRTFANCSAARSAGAAPVRRGDPGYSLRLDRDGDGVGCE
jgi:hypothetical protein